MVGDAVNRGGFNGDRRAWLDQRIDKHSTCAVDDGNFDDFGLRIETRGFGIEKHDIGIAQDRLRPSDRALAIEN